MNYKIHSQSSISGSAPATDGSVVDSPPYLIYRSDTALKPSYVSANSSALLGVAAEEFVGNPRIWEQIIPECDQQRVFDKFKELDSAATTCCVHRILDNAGVPMWVSHQVTAVLDNGAPSLCGFIVPLVYNDLSRLLEPSIAPYAPPTAMRRESRQIAGS